MAGTPANNPRKGPSKAAVEDKLVTPDAGAKAFERAQLGVEIQPGRFLLDEKAFSLASAWVDCPDPTLKKEIEASLTKRGKKSGGATSLAAGFDAFLARARGEQDTTMPITVFASNSLSDAIFSAGSSEDTHAGLNHAANKPGNILIHKDAPLTDAFKAQLILSEFSSRFASSPETAEVLLSTYRTVLSRLGEDEDETDYRAALCEGLGGLTDDATGALFFWFFVTGPEESVIDLHQSSNKNGSSPGKIRIKRGMVAQATIRALESDGAFSDKDEAAIEKCKVLAKDMYGLAVSAATEVVAAIKTKRDSKG